MKFKVTITAGDYVIFQVRSLFRFPSTAIMAVVLAVLAAMNIDVYNQFGAAVFMVIALTASLAFVAFAVFMQLVISFITIRVRDMKSFLCEHEFEFADDYIIEKTQYDETRYSWAAVSRYFITKKYFYIYVSSAQVHIVPKRFLSEQEIGELGRLLGEKAKR